MGCYQNYGHFLVTVQAILRHLTCPGIGLVFRGSGSGFRDSGLGFSRGTRMGP